MLSGLRRFFSPTVSELNELRDEVDKLRMACRKADAERTELLLEWERTRDSLARFLKRQGAQKAFPRVVDEDQDEDELDAEVRLLRMKFGA